MKDVDREPSPWWVPETEAILAVGSLVIFGGALCYVLLELIPAENEKYAMLMLGALIGVVKDTFGRYFQATKGAQDQRREANKVAENLATSAAAAMVIAADAEPGVATVTAPADVDVTVRDKTDAADSGELPPEEQIG